MSKNLLDYVGLGYFLEKIKTLFVTALGTSGNNLTWTKNGETSNITIPYATKAGGLSVTSTDNAVARFDGTTGAVQNSGVTINDSNHVTAAKFITSGGTSSQFVKGDGSLANNVKMNEIGWMGEGHNELRSLENLYYNVGANVFAFLNTNFVSVEYTNDGGTTWIDYEASAQQKIDLFTLEGTVYVGKKTNSSIAKTSNDAVRVTVSVGCGLYAHCQFLIARVWAAGGCSLKVEYTTYAEPTTFVEHVTYSKLNDNPGLIIIPFDKFLFGNNGVHDLRLTYSYNGGTAYVNNNKHFGYIRAYCNNVYSAPSQYAKTGHLYAINSSKKATFPGDVEAIKFVKSGGTSSQFLKADGSVDSSSYASTASPALTGTPTAPTAAASTNSTQIATTAFVKTAISGKQDTIDDLATIRSGASAGATALQPNDIPSWAKQSSKPTYTAQEVGALPASTTIPSKTSDLTNDSGFLTQHQDISGKENTSNKVTSLSSSSTDTLYPSAKCVYDLIKDSCVFIEGSDTYLDF